MQTMLAFLTVAYLTMLHGIPIALTLLACTFLPHPWNLTAITVVGPLLYTVCFALTAALLSHPHQNAIMPGRFQRDPASSIYRARRLYGLCWTSVYYHKPVYFVCLSVPLLKKALFRLFGYRGELNFTVYPDTWIRDLPLLEIGDGAYLSNRATFGTNMPMRNGTILVDRIRIGRRAMIGHMALVAAGATIGDEAEVGPGSKVGIRAQIGRGVVVGGNCCISHRATIGARTRVGISAHVGTKAVVPEDLTLCEGSVVAPGTHVKGGERQGT